MNDIERAIAWYENQNAYYGDKEAYQEDFRMNCLAIAALRYQAERMNPEPLTVEELCGMDAPVWCRVDNCSWIPNGGYWCLCNHGKIITPSLSTFFADDIPKWVFYRYPPKEEV